MNWDTVLCAIIFLIAAFFFIIVGMILAVYNFKTTAKWLPKQIELKEGRQLTAFTCSACDSLELLAYHYCPACGRNMINWSREVTTK